MIAKIIPIKCVRKSSFSALIKYLIDHQDKSERISQVMVTNCYTDDMPAALIEIQNTQDMNKRAKSDKTCHLVLSFPEGERLPHADLNEIEERFCNVLGFADHQRISVVHDDTNNLHIHIAINKIHPRNHTIHNPYYDYKKVASLCEQIEQEYGLTKVNHETRYESAADTNIETKAGIESLIGWIKRECLEEIKCADNWQDLHKVLERNGLEIKARGNGFVFMSSSGIAVKASSVDRSLSKASLVKRLGEYESIDGLTKTSQAKTKQYQPRPVHTRYDTTKLYARYQAEQIDSARQRTNQWEVLRNKRDRLIERAKHHAKLKRSIIKNISAGRVAKKIMFATAHQQFKSTIAVIKTDYRECYQTTKTKHSKMAWLDWLIKEAELGNHEALEILRSRRTTRHQGNNVSGSEINNSPLKDGFVETITKNGTVIYKVGSTVIRDDGKRLMVLPDTSSETLADILQMANQKYGTHLAINGTDEFRTHIAEVAAHNKMRITFDDNALEQYRQQLMNEQTLSRFNLHKKTPTTAKRISL